jgi:site-specific recombinase XerC
MDHFFVSHAKVRRFLQPLPGIDLDGVAFVQRSGALKDGTPFFLGSDGRPAEPLCSFFFELSKTLKASTMADYAYDLMDVVAFLGRCSVPTDLLSACEDDLVAYREFCTRDRERPVSAATWQRRRAAINAFYDWAVQTGTLRQRPYLRRANGRDVLAFGSTVDLDVRCLSYRQWRALRQVGLRGLRLDGGLDPAFRGSAPLRNCAAAELAVTTGIRLREFSCLLDVEVPAPGRDGMAATVRLEATAKYGLPRDVMIQQPTLAEIDVYRRTERAATISRARATLAGRHAELFVVSDVDTDAMRVTGRLHGRRRVFRIEAMSAELRRISVLDAGRGLEPMALFVGRGGRMLTKQRWEQVFTAAWTRTVQVLAGNEGSMEMPRRFRIHDMRHTFAVFMLAQLTALVAEDETRRREAGGHGGFLADHLARNPLLIVQRLLGHRVPASTMKYLTYLGQTNELVARAVAEWNDAEATYADYAAALSGAGVR